MSSYSTLSMEPGSMWAAYVLTINVVFGSGVLAMPHAIQKSGFLLGEVMLGVVSCVAWVTVMWTIEAISRLSYIKHLWGVGEVVPVAKNDEEGPIMAKEEFSPEDVLILEGNDISPDSRPEMDQIERWEANQLCQAFLGTKWAMAYDACLTIYTWAVMWLYVTVWCQAFVTMIPLAGTSFQECSTPFKGDCETSYRIFVGVFAVTMAVLCIKEWKAFERIQGFFTIFAYVCLLIMLTSIFVAVTKVPYIDSDGNIASNRSSAPYWADGNRAADFSQFGSLFGTCIFSQMAHQGTSQILSSMSKKEKAGQLFAFAFLTTTLFYTILSVAAAVYFGDLVNDIVTLNWETYSINDDHSKTTFTKILFCIIVIFPVGTTSAAYMFFVRTIGQQLQHWVPASYTERFTPQTLTVTCKVIAFTPPIIGGLLDGNVKTIVNVAGLFGFFVMIIFPSMLQIGSIRVCQRIGCVAETPFQGFYSVIPAVYALLVFGAGGLGLYIYNIVS